MKREQIENLRMWASGFLAIKRGGGVVKFSGEGAEEIGTLIFEIMKELEDEKQCLAAYRVSCAALEGERDSLRERYEKDNSFLVDELGKATAEFNRVRAERDSLKKDVAHLMTDRDVMRDERNRAASQRDSLREQNQDLQDEVSGLRWRLGDAEKERDSVRVELAEANRALRELTGKPLVQFALELDRKNKQLAGGGVA